MSAFRQQEYSNKNINENTFIRGVSAVDCECGTDAIYIYIALLLMKTAA